MMERADKDLNRSTQRRPATRSASGSSLAPAFVDRSATGAQLNALAQMMQSSAQVAELGSLVQMMQASPQVTAQLALNARLAAGAAAVTQRAEGEEEELLQGKFATVQRAEIDDEELLQGKFAPVQRAVAESAPAPSPNQTGLPDGLKSGVEALSGLSLDQVRVHYNSSHPAQLNAHAFAQGSEIHLAPGQEQHLPHEAWHVVQQAQGRVKPTMQMKDGVRVNDDAGLEREADVMGAKALNAAGSGVGAISAAVQSMDKQPPLLRKTIQRQVAHPAQPYQVGQSSQTGVIQQKIDGSAFNLVGESHNKVDRGKEKTHLKETYGIPKEKYWTELEFRLQETNLAGRRKRADPPIAHVRQQVIGVAASLEYMLSKMELAVGLNTGKTPQTVADEMPKVFALWERSICGGFLGFFMPDSNRNDPIRRDFALEPEEERRLEEAARPLMDIHAKLMEVKNWVEGGDIFIFSSRQKSIETTFRELIPLIRRMDATMGGVNTDHQSHKDVDNGLMDARNVGMIYGASQAGQAGTTGVWKVGDAHIKGLLPLEEGFLLRGSNVTLTPAQEFKDEMGH